MKAPKLVLNLIVAALLLPATAGFAASWSVPTVGNVDASAVFSPDGGTLYITSGYASSSPTGELYSINCSSQPGHINWQTNIQAAELFCSAAVGATGTVYVTSGNGDASLLSVHPADGSTAWPYPVGGPADTVPAIAADGTIYVTVDDSDDDDDNDGLYAIHPDGTRKWFYLLNASPSGDVLAEPQSSPVVGPDGTIYFRTGADAENTFPAADGYLFAINPDGTKKWVRNLPVIAEDDNQPAIADDAPVVGPDGTIYVTGGDGYLYAINPANGNTLWTLYVGETHAPPFIDSNGSTVLYLGNSSGQLFAITSAGSGQLIYTGSAAIDSTPAVAADGTIFITCTDGNLYELQKQSDGSFAETWHFHTGASIYSYPKLGSDGTVYFGSEDTFFYAVDPHSLFPVPPTPVQPPTGPPVGSPPTSPTGPGLTATACSGEVTLTWDAYAGATGYKVYRATAANGTYSLVGSTTTATTYTDTSVANGTTYYYVVLAVNGGNEIAISSYITITPEAAPAAPTSLVVAPGNQAAYLLSWSMVPGAVSYHVKRSTISGSETTIATTTVTSYIDNSGLQNGTTYYYEVSAVDSCGDESGNSAERSVTPENAYAPVFTGGFISGNNIYANCGAGVGGSGNSFTFTVSGPPNSTWTVYSLPEGNYYNDPQIIGTVTLDASGNGSFPDPGAGTFDWSSQFYQLVSGDVHSAVFGYSLVNIIDAYYNEQTYAPIQNPLVPLAPGTIGSVIPGDKTTTGGYVFWNSSDGTYYDLAGGGYIDDSTSLTTRWDYEWIFGEWAYPNVVNNTIVSWLSVDTLPYGYDSDTYYFSGFPCDWTYGYPGNYVMISFIGTMPSQ